MTTTYDEPAARDAARRRLAKNSADFDLLLERARADRSAGRAGSAAVWLQAAATHGWLNPGGKFADADLEHLVAALAAKLPERHGRRPGDASGRVLHVLTQGYQTGGSTQFLACWIDQDRNRRHHLCLTRQGSVPVPDKLSSRVGPRMSISRIDDSPGLLRRAARLRAMAAAADLVLVHAHPYDIVPGLALAGVPDLPPVMYVNHADHVFWTGTQIASTLLNMRSSGAELAVRRRGVEQARSTVLARPLRLAGRTMGRSDAKRLLGVEADQVVIATVADPSKYRTGSRATLLELVMPVLHAAPRSVLLAAGPSLEGEWAEAARATNGRVRPLGFLSDPSVVQQAADVYLDSFPFSSLTSLLETGSLATPVVTFAGHPVGCEVFGADTPGVDEHMFRPTTADELQAALDRLLRDPDLRAHAGEAVASGIADTHSGDGWRSGVDQLISQARRSVPDPVPPVPRQEADVDLLTLLVMEQTAFSRGRDGAVLDNLGLLPTPTRLREAARLARTSTPPRVPDLLPDHLRHRLAAAVRGRGRARGGQPAGDRSR